MVRMGRQGMIWDNSMKKPERKKVSKSAEVHIRLEYEMLDWLESSAAVHERSLPAEIRYHLRERIKELQA